MTARADLEKDCFTSHMTQLKMCLQKKKKKKKKAESIPLTKLWIGIKTKPREYAYFKFA